MTYKLVNLLSPRHTEAVAAWGRFVTLEAARREADRLTHWEIHCVWEDGHDEVVARMDIVNEMLKQGANQLIELQKKLIDLQVQMLASAYPRSITYLEALEEKQRRAAGDPNIDKFR